MKRTYKQPKIVEYGRLAQLTLGTGTVYPDLFNGVNTNTNCTATGVTSCNVSHP